jgi:hypothetical protein
MQQAVTGQAFELCLRRLGSKSSLLIKLRIASTRAGNLVRMLDPHQA